MILELNGPKTLQEMESVEYKKHRIARALVEMCADEGGLSVYNLEEILHLAKLMIGI